MDTPAAGIVAAIVRRLTEERMRQGLTQEELAVRAGIDRSHVGLLEKGSRHPSLEVALSIAWALDMPLGSLLAEVGGSTPEGKAAPLLVPPDWVERRPADGMLRKGDRLQEATALTLEMLGAAIEKTYGTLDLIDAQLLAAESSPLAETVELANLSAMLGNIFGGAIAEASDGLYQRNGPHKYPDLVPLKNPACELEIKVALAKNKPKGHLPKPGPHLTVRYVLGDRAGQFDREKRGDTIWIWEIRVGNVGPDDFSISNTPGDSGKTAVFRSDAFYAMDVVFLDERFIPYKNANYPGRN